MYWNYYVATENTFRVGQWVQLIGDSFTEDYVAKIIEFQTHGSIPGVRIHIIGLKTFDNIFWWPVAQIKAMSEPEIIVALLRL